MKQKEVMQERFSTIYAASYVSESELKLLDSNYDASLETAKPEKFKNMLWSLGLDSRYDYVRTDGVQHRNKLNQSVFCSRWVGNERTDTEWITSGYASREAIDKSKNSPLLDSLYKEKLFTVDTQFYLEEKDRSCKVED
jgi:hypothetical protein